MKVPDIIIAIDGYSSTGKSSFARLVSREFGFIYLDSGALYRAVTVFAREEGLISSDNVVSPSLRDRLPAVKAYFDSEGRTCLNGRCVEKEIRSMEVSSQVSPISAEPYVRAFVDSQLRAMSEHGRVVMDGRDIGSTVFPDAQLKLFMTASPEVRARRRFDELKAKGQNPDMDEVRRNIEERDYLDSHREASPLRRASDSYLLDNSDMTMEEELSWIRGLLQGKFNILD